MRNSLTLLVLLEQKYGKRSYFVTRQYGQSVIDLMYWSCVLALFISAFILVGLKYWASLVTNRELLQKLVGCVLIYGTIQFIFTLWATCVHFLVFKGIDWEVFPPFDIFIHILISIFLSRMIRSLQEYSLRSFSALYFCFHLHSPYSITCSICPTFLAKLI
jgi:Na+-driven multidrug efflux pump